MPTTRAIHKIAMEITQDWKHPYYAAVPYLQAMLRLENPADTYGVERGSDIISYFLANATTWRGETARRIKAELKELT